MGTADYNLSTKVKGYEVTSINENPVAHSPLGSALKRVWVVKLVLQRGEKRVRRAVAMAQHEDEAHAIGEMLVERRREEIRVGAIGDEWTDGMVRKDQ